MKILAAVVLLFVAANALEKRQFGICVEECSLTSNTLIRSLTGKSQCPDGQICASNGCGHTCQPDPNASGAKACGNVFCFMYCDHGYVKDSNGCDTCQCQNKPIDATKCPGVMCAMFCEAGFQTGSDGCPICKCNDAPHILG